MADIKLPPKRRKRVRRNQGEQAKVTVYLYPDELEQITKAANGHDLSVSGYMAFAAKEKAKTDLSKK